ncbi:putative maleylacetoacetate isomerase [Oesophagostomum dentatum]|uniref:Putative maleylacetoacetate isomerase n=1 Tax=Oesophagostomum dentatum TaxID=61180 RepID=A0A0B1TUJ3_OESDE|nr:putative maleylacetoacetate isomerase [Oesophagostomum dentatum]
MDAKFKIVAGIQPVQNLRILKYLNGQTPGSGAEWASHWLTDGLRDLEAMLARSAGVYAVGDKVTMADLCIPSIVYNAKRWGVDTSAFPTLTRVDEALAKIPEFEAAHPDKQPDAKLNA